MLEKRESLEDAEGDVLQDPCDIGESWIAWIPISSGGRWHLSLQRL